MTVDWIEIGPCKIACGDCRDVMGSMSAQSIDSIVTDPPYGLSFMGKGWDHGIPGVEFWQAALRVAKPGAHLLAFGGTRTFHRLTCAIEDAGWEIRDCIGWLYGSGFPKSLDVSKAIDKEAGVEREVGPVDKSRAGRLVNQSGKYETNSGWSAGNRTVTNDPPATAAARQWQGWGTALKPAWEPIILARKPLVGTVAENVQRDGTGALNIDGCRVNGESRPLRESGSGDRPSGIYGDGTYGSKAIGSTELGRFPANIIHDGSEEVLGVFPDSKSCDSPSNARPVGRILGGARSQGAIYPGENGSAARFFYCAKASRSERGDGNNHPTVKPLALMRYLVKLITPPGGTVFDPFCGSGSTGLAIAEGQRFIGIEQAAEYMEIIQRRLAKRYAVARQRELIPC